MAINWTDYAQHNINDIVEYTQSLFGQPSNSYLKNLTAYIFCLETSPYLGKPLFELGLVGIRQLLYKKHRIIYYLKNNCVYILFLIHTSRDFDKYSFYLKRLFH